MKVREYFFPELLVMVMCHKFWYFVSGTEIDKIPVTTNRGFVVSFKRRNSDCLVHVAGNICEEKLRLKINSEKGEQISEYPETSSVIKVKLTSMYSERVECV
jgi:hypothetical protein